MLFLFSGGHYCVKLFEEGQTSLYLGIFCLFAMLRGFPVDRIGLPNLSIIPVIISKSVYSVSHFSIIVSPKKSVNLRQGRYLNYP